VGRFAAGLIAGRKLRELKSRSLLGAAFSFAQIFAMEEKTKTGKAKRDAAG
jgi:hypothetical protein